MTRTEAIRKTRADVRMVRYANGQCVILTWSAKHAATWQSQPMEYRSGVNTLRSARIQYALEQLGWDHEDAVYEGMKDEDDVGYRRSSWETVVRSALDRGCV